MNRSLNAVALAVMLTGLMSMTLACSSTGGSLDEASPVGETASVDSSVPVGSTAESRSQEANWEAFEERILNHEKLISQCMKLEGFEYIAALTSDVYYEKAAMEADARGEAVNLDDVSVPTDPNVEIRNNLSESNLLAYNEALWGTEESVGCIDATFEQANGLSMEDIVASQPDPDEVDAVVEADPRVEAARSEFQACVEADGFVGRSVQDLLQIEQEYLESIPTERQNDREVLDWADNLNTTYKKCSPPLGDVLTEVHAETIDRLSAERGVDAAGE